MCHRKRGRGGETHTACHGLLPGASLTRWITISDNQDDDENAIVRVDNIEFETSRNDDPYARLTAHNGETFSAWEGQHSFVKQAEDDLLDSWAEISYEQNGDYKNVQRIEPAPEDAIPDEDEIAEQEDPLADVPREERIRKSTALNAASRVMDEGTTTDEFIKRAKAIDAAFVEWLTEDDGGPQ